MSDNFFQSFKNKFNIDTSILNEYENILHSDEYKIDKNVSNIRTHDQINKYSNIKNLFYNISEYIEKIGKNLIFDDIWIVESDLVSTDTGNVPYVPHIDKIRKYKIMIYLNDIEINSGPLHLININPEIFENKRKKFSKDYKKNFENVVSDYNINEYKPYALEILEPLFFLTQTFLILLVKFMIQEKKKDIKI